MPPFKPPEECPICGVAVPRSALACPTCGSDERTGWNEDQSADGLDLPTDDFDYDEFLATEFSGKERINRLPWYWLAGGFLVTVAILLAYVSAYL